MYDRGNVFSIIEQTVLPRLTQFRQEASFRTNSPLAPCSSRAVRTVKGLEAVIAVVEVRFSDGERENADTKDERARNIVRFNLVSMTLLAASLTHFSR